MSYKLLATYHFDLINIADTVNEHVDRDDDWVS